MTTVEGRLGELTTPLLRGKSAHLSGPCHGSLDRSDRWDIFLNQATGNEEKHLAHKACC